MIPGHDPRDLPDPPDGPALDAQPGDGCAELPEAPDAQPPPHYLDTPEIRDAIEDVLSAHVDRVAEAGINTILVERWVFDVADRIIVALRDAAPTAPVGGPGIRATATPATTQPSVGLAWALVLLRLFPQAFVPLELLNTLSAKGLLLDGALSPLGRESAEGFHSLAMRAAGIPRHCSRCEQPEHPCPVVAKYEAQKGRPAPAATAAPASRRCPVPGCTWPDKAGGCALESAAKLESAAPAARQPDDAAPGGEK